MQKKYEKIFLIIGCLIISSLACKSPSTSTTNTVTPATLDTSTLVSAISTKTLTASGFTETPTQTPFPSSTPNPNAVVLLKETHTIEKGGFSFESLVGYKLKFVDDNGILIQDPYDTVFIVVNGKELKTGHLSIDDFSSIMKGVLSITMDFRWSDAQPITIDGVEGQAYDLTTKDNSMEGLFFVVESRSDYVIYGFCLCDSIIMPDRWESEGKEKFDKVISSIVLLDK